MGTHPIFESDFDCLTEWILGTFEYRKTIHDLIVINRFMKTDDKTIKKLEGLLQVLDGNQRITYNGLLQAERYIAQIHKRIRNESIKGQEENTVLLKHQKEKIDNLEETKTKLEKEKDVLEEKLKHSGSCPICWNPYDCDKNGGNIRHMKCGHTVCSQCLEQLKRPSTTTVKTEIKCPTCTESCQ